MTEHMQIGEVANRTGLSLRTIRYYGEVGLAAPSARSAGGFRLYTETDVERLLLIKQMKPLDFTVEEMRELLGVLDALDGTSDGDRERRELLERLGMYHDVAEQRCAQLRAQLEGAEELAGRLQAYLNRRPAARRR